MSHQSEENTWEIKERLLGIEECAKKRKRHCFTHMPSSGNNNIDIPNCRGQGYNNNSNMSGIYKGAQAVILEKNPQAIFIH